MPEMPEPALRIGTGWTRATIAVWILLMLAALALIPTDDGPVALSLLLMPWSGLVLSAPLVAFARFAWRTPAPTISSELRRRVRMSILVNLLITVVAIGVFAMISGEAVVAAPVLMAGSWIPALIAYRLVTKLPTREDSEPARFRMTAATVIGVVGILLSIPLLGSHLASRSAGPNSLLKEDLRNVVMAEDAFFADSVYYAPLARLNISARPGNTIRLVLAADNLSWGAVVTTERRPVSCAAWDGAAFPAQIFPSSLTQRDRPDKAVPLCWTAK